MTKRDLEQKVLWLESVNRYQIAEKERLCNLGTLREQEISTMRTRLKETLSAPEGADLVDYARKVKLTLDAERETVRELTRSLDAERRRRLARLDRLVFTRRVEKDGDANFCFQTQEVYIEWMSENCTYVRYSTMKNKDVLLDLEDPSIISYEILEPEVSS